MNMIPFDPSMFPDLITFSPAGSSPPDRRGAPSPDYVNPSPPVAGYAEADTTSTTATTDHHLPEGRQTYRLFFPSDPGVSPMWQAAWSGVKATVKAKAKRGSDLLWRVDCEETS